ncbi:MAG: ATP-dependent Clp protease proteolytic subunit [Phycisphaerales bacterium]|nr:ATP-dependent Clp protease proteolytic subunit [Phycisphaerales bacterium]
MSEEDDPPLLVPHVIDSSGRTEREFDIWSRLLADRIVMCSGEIEEEMASSICAQLLYLALDNPDAEVSIYVNGVGGSVTDGLAIIDTMRAIPCSVATYVVGCAPSMSSMIAACGTKGRRFATRHAWHMMHQGRIGGVIEGQVTDLEIEARHMQVLEDRCNKLYAEMTSKTLEQITEDCDRDRWLNAEEMLEYGLIDSIIERVPLQQRVETHLQS